MKKIINYIGIGLTIISFPFNVLAYSNKVIMGGQNVGININSNGVMVVGFYKVNGVYNGSKLMAGDYIYEVGSKSVNTINELVKAIDSEAKDNQVEIKYRRGNNTYKTTLNLEYKDNVYKTGLYVKDNLLGNGTLTYIDPKTKIYGALGHNVIESNTKSRVEIKDGSIFKSVISSVTKSSDGNPGSINTKFYKDKVYGTINKNVESGIFGNYLESIDNDALIEVASIDDVKLGEASIYTNLYNNDVREYKINILRVDKGGKIKNIYFEVTDEALLNKTGGIVQGMSGSPIVQNGKLIGAVTHVLIDDVTTGYGISIITMLEEGEKNNWFSGQLFYNLMFFDS